MFTDSNDYSSTTTSLNNAFYTRCPAARRLTALTSFSHLTNIADRILDGDNGSFYDGGVFDTNHQSNNVDTSFGSGGWRVTVGGFADSASPVNSYSSPRHQSAAKLTSPAFTNFANSWSLSGGTGLFNPLFPSYSEPLPPQQACPSNSDPVNRLNVSSAQANSSSRNPVISSPVLSRDIPSKSLNSGKPTSTEIPSSFSSSISSSGLSMFSPIPSPPPSPELSISATSPSSHDHLILPHSPIAKSDISVHNPRTLPVFPSSDNLNNPRSQASSSPVPPGSISSVDAKIDPAPVNNVASGPPLSARPIIPTFLNATLTYVASTIPVQANRPIRAWPFTRLYEQAWMWEWLPTPYNLKSIGDSSSTYVSSISRASEKLNNVTNSAFNSNSNISSSIGSLYPATLLTTHIHLPTSTVCSEIVHELNTRQTISIRSASQVLNVNARNVHKCSSSCSVEHHSTQQGQAYNTGLPEYPGTDPRANGATTDGSIHFNDISNGVPGQCSASIVASSSTNNQTVEPSVVHLTSSASSSGISGLSNYATSVSKSGASENINNSVNFNGTINGNNSVNGGGKAGGPPVTSSQCQNFAYGDPGSLDDNDHISTSLLAVLSTRSLSGRFATDVLFGTDHAMLGFRGMYTSGVNREACDLLNELACYNSSYLPASLQPRADKQSSVNKSSLSGGTSLRVAQKPREMTKDASRIDVGVKPFSNPTFVSLGVELYHHILNASGGLALGIRYMRYALDRSRFAHDPPTLSRTDEASKLVKSAGPFNFLDSYLRGTAPFALTLTLNPLVGALASTYAVQVGRQASLAARWEVNCYSWESQVTMGLEGWWDSRCYCNQAISNSRLRTDAHTKLNCASYSRNSPCASCSHTFVKARLSPFTGETRFICETELRFPMQFWWLRRTEDVNPSSSTTLEPLIITPNASRKRTEKLRASVKPSGARSSNTPINVADGSVNPATAAAGSLTLERSKFLLSLICATNVHSLLSKAVCGVAVAWEG